jgi:hypothetical protein
MGIGTAFRQGASSIIRTFTNEFKPCTFKSISKSSEYDPETGEYSEVFEEYTIPIAFSNISDEAPYPSGFKSNHKIVYISGNDLPVTPKRGDQIIDWNGVKHIIDDSVSTDMYNALYTAVVMQDNEG